MQRFFEPIKSQNPVTVGDALGSILGGITVVGGDAGVGADVVAPPKPPLGGGNSDMQIFDDDDDLETVTKYELSLAEFPIFFLSTKIPKGIESINYNDIIYVKGQPVERYWQVTWNKKYGPPTQSVAETFFALYQIWAESGFESTWIHFKTVSAILKRKGLAKNQSRYKQIIRDLNCLCNVFIEAKNAFYDTTEKRYVDMCRSIYLKMLYL